MTTNNDVASNILEDGSSIFNVTLPVILFEVKSPAGGGYQVAMKTNQQSLADHERVGDQESTSNRISWALVWAPLSLIILRLYWQAWRRHWPLTTTLREQHLFLVSGIVSP